MKEHKDAFDDWLKDQIDRAPVPNPDAYWKKTSAKLPGSKSAWVKWFLPLLLLIGSIGGALYFMSDSGEADLPITTETKEQSTNNIEEASTSENDAYIVDVENTEEINRGESDVQNNDLASEEEADVNLEETHRDNTDLEDIAVVSRADQPVATPKSAQTEPTEDVQSIRQQSDVRKAETVNKVIVVEDLPKEDNVAKSENSAEKENSTEDKTALNEGSSESTTIVDPVDETGREVSNKTEENLIAAKEIDSEKSADENSVESEEETVEEEIETSAEAVIDEEEEAAIPNVLKKISDQPKWTAFTSVSAGLLPFSKENTMPVAGLEVGAEYAFSPSWGVSAAALFTGISNINQSEEFTRISYGFDRIEETATLTFSQAFYMQMPIRIHYRKNRHMFSAGVVPGLVMNGRASLRDFGEESSRESVWGYTEGIRRWNIAGAIEYDYAISENWQLGLLFHGSSQTIMKNNNDSPGFQYIQLRIRKWW